MRSLIFPILFLSLWGIASLPVLPNLSQRNSLPVILVAFITAWAPPLVRETLAWVSGAYLVISQRPDFPNRALPLILAGGLLVGSAGGSFRERVVPFPKIARLTETSASVSAQVRAMVAAHPERLDLDQPLSRVVSNFRIGEFRTNTVPIAGFSTLDGYWFPSRRFVALLAGFAHRMPDWSNVDYSFSESTPGFSKLAELYNVLYAVTRNPDGSFEVQRTNSGSQPAWFSLRGVALQPDLATMITRLEEATPDRAVKDQQLVPQADSDKFDSIAASMANRDCRDAKVLEV
ncbi:MAG: hypothetical protein AAB425_13295, partial [Bdellovibrionota bacterium]